MDTFLLPVATIGFVMGWPMELLIQKFPMPNGTAPSSQRRWVVCIITALLFAALAASIGINRELAPALVLTALIVPASAIDLRYRIIPDAINLPGAVVVYALAVFAEPDRWLEFLLSGVIAAGVLYVSNKLTGGGIGLGDVKMVLMMGFCLGEYVLVAIFFGFLLSLAPSLWILATKGVKAGRKTGFPFGPFLAGGAMIALLWGPQLWDLWLGGG